MVQCRAIIQYEQFCGVERSLGVLELSWQYRCGHGSNVSRLTDNFEVVV